MSEAKIQMNQTITKVLRPEVLASHAYPVSDARGFIKLDAMENPYELSDALRDQLAHRLRAVSLNRYPVSSYLGLKSALTQHYRVPAHCSVMVGNGSDELIDIIAKAVARPGAVILAPVPGFVMYELSARYAGAQFVGVPLNPDFSLSLPAMLAAIAEHQPAVIYLAYPNNPTGNCFSDADMREIIRVAPGLVVADEAYQPFAMDTWMTALIDSPEQFPNLIVMRTVSKLGLAGVRLGYMAGPKDWIDQFEKIRPPYNVNVLTEAAVLFALEHVAELDAQAGLLREAREHFFAQLAALPGVTPFPSRANFILARFADSAAVNLAMKSAKILVKDVGGMHPLLKNCLRLTVGLPSENAAMLVVLKSFG
jgi:histidinol-phosphate aminotransferase